MAHIVGEMLIETGHALQRAGFRAMGKTIVKLPRFNTIGARSPKVSNGALIEPTATIIGNVTMGPETYLGDSSVIRADTELVTIGMGTIIAKDVVITASSNKSAVGNLPALVSIGSKVSVGDGAVLQSCIVGDNVVIGKNCVVSEGAYVEPKSSLEDGSVVLPGHRIPANQLWGGNPARFIAEKSDH